MPISGLWHLQEARECSCYRMSFTDSGLFPLAYGSGIASSGAVTGTRGSMPMRMIFYSYNISALSGEGIRTYLMMKWELGDLSEIRLKYGLQLH